MDIVDQHVGACSAMDLDRLRYRHVESKFGQCSLGERKRNVTRQKAVYGRKLGHEEGPGED